MCSSKFKNKFFIGFILFLLFSINVSGLITPHIDPPHPDIVFDINVIETINEPNFGTSTIRGSTGIVNSFTIDEKKPTILEEITSINKTTLLVVLAFLTIVLFILLYAKYLFTSKMHRSKELSNSVVDHLALHINEKSSMHPKEIIIDKLKNEGYSEKIIRKAVRRSKSIKK